MKTATFFEGILIALITSFIGSLLLFAFSTLFSSSFLIHLLISGFTFGYLLYLLSRSKERVGRIVVLSIWFIGVAMLWLTWPPMSVFVLAHLASIWLVRSLYFYSSLISSLLDLVLNGFSAAIAIATAAHTESLFLTIWCFFLTQALFVLIPKNIAKSATSSSTSFKHEDNFQHAYRAAEAAVSKLSTNQ